MSTLGKETRGSAARGDHPLERDRSARPYLRSVRLLAGADLICVPRVIQHDQQPLARNNASPGLATSRIAGGGDQILEPRHIQLVAVGLDQITRLSGDDPSAARSPSACRSRFT